MMERASSDDVRTLVAEARLLLQNTSPSALLDAQLLMGFILNRSRAEVIAHDDEVLSAALADRFRSLVIRRARSEPLAYLVGEREFFGLSFEVNPAVLVPRPESELIVEQALRFARDTPGALAVADMGCGSGCIGIAIVHQLRAHGREVCLVGVDKSPAALEVARRNAMRTGVAPFCEFIESDWYRELSGREGGFHLMVSNPPYIAEGDSEVSPELAFEPSLALYAGADGLAAIRPLIAGAARFLAPRGALYFEFGRQAPEMLRGLVKAEFPDASFAVHSDLAGCPRVGEVRAKC